MERACFFTSIALNYLPKALALAKSVFDVYPHTRFVISMADLGLLDSVQLQAIDGLVRDFADQGRTLEFLDPLELYDRPDLLSFKFNVVEICTCVKPAVSIRLLERDENVTYLDPDTILYTRLPDKNAAGWDMEVTPHVLSPSLPGSAISERKFMYYGVFNLGYFGVRRSPQALAFLRWWKDFCVNYGADAPQTGLFVDQKPVDLLPCFVDHVRVLRHPGCNVAWWNLFADGRQLANTRTVTFEGEQTPLVFFHFSNLHRPTDPAHRKIANPLPDQDQALAAGISSVLLKDHQVVLDLFNEYDRLTGEFGGACRTIGGVPSARARRQVPLTIRLLLAEALRRGMTYSQDPFHQTNSQVVRRCLGYLLRNTSWRDAKLIIGSNIQYLKLSLSLRLLRHQP
ncbi:hypothetical protein MW290_27325 [Aquincola tertiaricarbonis]|uniref:Glycosyl transferase n=1 Tax=Aquincola tertiaricarbonis TaxID=391953 RepID=A0ABY4S9G8_AQUTE|nr:hypothetical protein [Aquincola tertiaricarbonis]URI09280.1 hypothetical protein MW290_27325 [Aquincola tertiaricarbonis]